MPDQAAGECMKGITGKFLWGEDMRSNGPPLEDWLPVCNPLHNRSLSPAVKRKPFISTGYQRARRSRHAGSGVDPDFIPLPDFSTSLLLTF